MGRDMLPTPTICTNIAKEYIDARDAAVELWPVLGNIRRREVLFDSLEAFIRERERAAFELGVATCPKQDV